MPIGLNYELKVRGYKNTSDYTLTLSSADFLCVYKKETMCFLSDRPHTSGKGSGLVVFKVSPS